MASLGQTFHPDAVPAGEFDALPVGTYLAQIIESSVSPAKSGDGQVLKLSFEVLEGELERRRHWEYLNIVHSNPDAQRIGQQALAKLCRALGLAAIDDSEELHFRPLMLTIISRARSSCAGLRTAKAEATAKASTVPWCRAIA